MVWINQEIDLPDHLVDAQQAGTLVIFAGAGVSVSPPSFLPDFPDLARQIAAGTVELLDEDKKALDRFLGRCENRGVRVEERAREILDRPGSAPTELHKHLVALFGGADQVRLVTTNFDRHFTTVASDAFGPGALPLYVGPALPLGREAQGVIYLHGALDDRRQGLVLTDAAFGRAYITDGWATRFLVELFQNFVVCFVGYGHNDPPMHYLSRSLPPGKPRFALVAENSTTEWRALGISPVPYRLRDGEAKHGALTQLFDDWGRAARRGVLEHAERIRALTSRDAPLAVDDDDYLRRALRDPIRCQFFRESARDIRWLRFAVEAGALARLFDMQQVPEAEDYKLAQWIAEHFMRDHPSEVIALLTGQRMQVGYALWDALGRCVALAEPSFPPDQRSAWLLILLQTRKPNWHVTWFEHALGAAGENDLPSSLTLFAFIITPIVDLREPWRRSDDASPLVRATVSLIGDHHSLNEAWQKALRPRIPDCHRALIALIGARLTEAHLLVRCAGAGDNIGDAVSWGRAAIEPHGQDRYPDPIDVVIDAAREILDYLWLNDRDQARAVCSTWLDAAPPILRRLALYGFSVDTQFEPISILKRTLDLGWLDDWAAHHEVFQLLARSYVAVTEEDREAFLLGALARREGLGGAEDGDDERAQRREEREQYNLLTWLLEAAPGSEVTRKRLGYLQEQHPEWLPSEHPDLTRWSSGAGFVQTISPKSPEELLASAPTELMDFLLSFSGRVDLDETPSREGLLAAVKDAVQRDFGWGRELVGGLLLKGAGDQALWESVIEGWAGASLDAAQWQEALSLIEAHTLIEERAPRAVASLLEKAVEAVDVSVDQAQAVQRIAARVIRQDGGLDGLLIQDEPDWLGLAINHPAGRAMMAWLRALLAERRAVGETWLGYPAPAWVALEGALAQDNVSGERARTIVGAWAHVLFGLDAEWWRTYVLPLFDWDRDRKSASQAWQGYLHWGRTHPALFAAMLPVIERTYDELSGTALGRTKETFSQVLADVALVVTPDPWHSDGWLPRYIDRSLTVDRMHWAGRVKHGLAQLAPEGAREKWETWIKDYWQDRLTGVPRPIEPGEGEEMAEWTLGLAELFPDAVSLLERTPVALNEHTHLFMELEDHPLTSTQPSHVARLVLRMLSAAEPLNWQCRPLEQVVRVLAGAGADRVMIQRICERMVQLLCSNADGLAREFPP